MLHLRYVTEKTIASGPDGARAVPSSPDFLRLERGAKVGLTACSNGLPEKARGQVKELCRTLHSLGLEPCLSPYLFERAEASAGTPAERARALMGFYADPEIRAVFDISGGDRANELLELLDYDLIRRAAKPFWGYSDLSVIIGSLYSQAGLPSALFQLRTLAWDRREQQTERFAESVLNGGEALWTPVFRPVQGSFSEPLEGTLLGGNIRCLLKLAGTPYWPDFSDKLLFLESWRGGVPQMTALLCQLRQMGVLRQLRGLLLGTFTELEEAAGPERIGRLVCEIADHPDLPVAKTQEVGHGPDSCCLLIGGRIRLARHS